MEATRSSLKLVVVMSLRFSIFSLEDCCPCCNRCKVSVLWLNAPSCSKVYHGFFTVILSMTLALEGALYYFKVCKNCL